MLMRGANEDLVPLSRRLYELFAKGDLPGILPLLCPDVEWAEPENPFNPAAGVHRGHSGFLEWARIGNESEEILSLAPERFLQGEDCVAVVGESTCRVRRTGKTYTTAFVHLVQFRDGKVSSFREFFDTFAAAEAFKPD